MPWSQLPQHPSIRTRRDDDVLCAMCFLGKKTGRNYRISIFKNRLQIFFWETRIWRWNLVATGKISSPPIVRSQNMALTLSSRQLDLEAKLRDEDLLPKNRAILGHFRWFFLPFIPSDHPPVTKVAKAIEKSRQDADEEEEQKFKVNLTTLFWKHFS